MDRLLDQIMVQGGGSSWRALTEKYGVRQAPTLVVRTGDGFEKFRGVSDIKGWLMHTATRG